MAKNATYVVRFRRRREGKTNYKKRLQFLKSKKLRFVVRISNKNCVCQVVKYSPEGDKTLITVRSNELKEYSYKGNTGNRKATYLTGYLCAKKSQNKKAILDMGLQHLHPKGRLYSALKGAVDGGMDIPHDEAVLPDTTMFEELKSILDKMDKIGPKKPATAKVKKPDGSERFFPISITNVMLTEIEVSDQRRKMILDRKKPMKTTKEGK